MTNKHDNIRSAEINTIPTEELNIILKSPYRQMMSEKFRANEPKYRRLRFLAVRLMNVNDIKVIEVYIIA